MESELETQVTKILQLEQDKKQLETQLSSLRVHPKQLEIHSKNEDLETESAQHQKDLAKCKKEAAVFSQQKRKAETEAEELKRTVSRLRQELTESQTLVQALAQELQKALNECGEIKNLSGSSLKKAKELIRDMAELAPQERGAQAQGWRRRGKALQLALPLKSEDERDEESLVILDTIIRRLNEGRKE